MNFEGSDWPYRWPHKTIWYSVFLSLSFSVICSLYVACIPQVAGRREHLSWRRNQLVGPFRIVPKILFLAQKNQEKSRENKKKELEAERVWKGKGECCFGSLQFYKVWKLHMPDWTEGIKERNRTEHNSGERSWEQSWASCPAVFLLQYPGKVIKLVCAALAGGLKDSWLYLVLALHPFKLLLIYVAVGSDDKGE